MGYTSTGHRSISIEADRALDSPFMNEHHSSSGQLHRGLKKRHIQLIALGAVVATGLFLDSAGARNPPAHQ